VTVPVSPGYDALRTGAGVVDFRDFGVVVVAGADARTFLQSLVSQDLDSIASGQGCDSLLLQPTGKMGTRFRLLALDEEFWLVVEPGASADLAGALARYVIRVDVEIEDRSAAMGVVALRGPGAVTVASAAGAPVPEADHGHAPWGAHRIARVPGATGGLDVVGPLDQLDDAESALRGAGAVPAGAPDWERARVEDGVPRQGVDLDEDTIPQEAFLDVTAVSFDKGCFLGQELVCRIRDRGHVNRLLRRVRVGGTPPPVGAEIVVGDKVVGGLTSVVALEDGSVALGYVRREVEPGASVTVRWDGGEADAVVDAVPPAP